MVRSASSNRVSRRTLVGSTAAGGVLIGLAPLRFAAARANPPTTVTTDSHSLPGPNPGLWRTWLLTSPDDIRPARPGAVSKDEIAELLGFQAHPTAAMTAAIATWGATPLLAPWCDLATAAFDEFGHSGIVQTRDYALLFTAMNDAVLAAWDAQLAYQRPSPAATDERIKPAAVAAAAATVLAHFFPQDAVEINGRAWEAQNSRCWAGIHYQIDDDTGLLMGRRVGSLVTALARADEAAGAM